MNLENADVAIVLGSGLGGVSDMTTSSRSVAYASLPGFSNVTVSGHQGRLVAGEIGGKRCLLLCGRVHQYEGYQPAQISFGVRVAAALGARTLIATNAAGAVDPSLVPGEIVAISDHINLTSASPLTGRNDDRLGPRFLDMSNAYDADLRQLAATESAKIFGRPLREAIYAGVTGPTYETPAEVRALQLLGAGLVGMSTVHEVIAARHSGLTVLGLSLVANRAAGLGRGSLRHDDVQRVAADGAATLGRLIESLICFL